MFFCIGFFMLNDVIKDKNNMWNIIRLILLIIPHFSYSMCICGFIQITWENNMCKICKSSDMIEMCAGKYLCFLFYVNCHYF